MGDWSRKGHADHRDRRNQKADDISIGYKGSKVYRPTRKHLRDKLAAMEQDLWLEVMWCAFPQSRWWYDAFNNSDRFLAADRRRRDKHAADIGKLKDRFRILFGEEP